MAMDPRYKAAPHDRWTDRRVYETGELTQVMTDSYVVIEDSEIDARFWDAVVYTVQVVDQAAKVALYGANKADFTDEIQVTEVTGVAAASNTSLFQRGANMLGGPGLFGYYRLKGANNAAGVVATVKVNGLGREI